MRSESSYHENQLSLSKQESEANEMFQKTLNAYLKDVNNLIQDANTTVEKMAKGQVKDIREAMTAVEKTGIGLELVIEIRNKLESHGQITQTQI